MKIHRLAWIWMTLLATPAAAQGYDENPSGRSIFALADAWIVAANGEPSWLDGGFGKSRFDGTDDRDLRLRPFAIEGDLVWQPHLSWSLDATIAATAQHGQEQAVDLSEAYLSYRHDPIGSLRVSARAGLLWPNISTEHGGPAWSVSETITPSAINSWIGEEVKLIAGEVTASAPIGSGRLAGSVALFGFNDTAGTLLAFRGWALHDQKATVFSHQPLPTLDAFMVTAQAPKTRPVIELDDRPGIYARLGWSSEAIRLTAFYYDNRGDPEAVNDQLQWGWRTRFASLSAQLGDARRTTLTAQAMTGTTQMGFPMPDRIWVDTRFRSAFLLATRRLGTVASVSGRIEAFGTRGRGSVLAEASDEDGWAVTAAARRRFGDHVTQLAELLHLESTRDERVRLALAPRQTQTVAQLSVRLTL
jgi:hypothetical protein